MQLTRRQCELTLALCRAGLQHAGNDFALARDLIDLGEAAQAEAARLAEADAAAAGDAAVPPPAKMPPAKND